MAITPRFGMSLISPGQAQKELFHNEAIQTLDLLIAACAEDGPGNSPPASPSTGSCYIVGDAPTGAWAGKAYHLAGYTDGGWRFVAPIDGMEVYLRAAAVTAKFAGGAWVLVPAIAAPSGGATVDSESRATIGQILSALRQHGLIGA